MEGEDQEGAVGGDQALTSFNISEAELIGLQQGLLFVLHTNHTTR